MFPAGRCVFTACLAALSLLATGTAHRVVVHGQAPALEAVIVQLRVGGAPRAFDAAHPARMTPAERNAWRGASDRFRLRDNERRAASPRARVVAVIGTLGGTVTRHFHALPALAARVPADAIDRLREHPDVVMVSPDRRQQARLDTSVPTVRPGPFWSAGFLGGSVNVAVIDTGIDLGNEYLDKAPASAQSRVCSILAVPAYRAADAHPEEDVESPDDASGHGTIVAGIIASTHPVYGGVAPGVGRLLNVKVAFKDFNGDTQPYQSEVVTGVEWSLAPPAPCTSADTPELLNYSFGDQLVPDSPGSDPYDGTFQFLARYFDAVAGQFNKVVTVPAGGGTSGALDSPGIGYNVISVSAMDTRGDTDRSNDVPLGPFGTSDYRRKPDLVAPATVSVATSYLGSVGATSTSTPVGTSLSAAFAAGVAALILDSDFGGTAIPEGDRALVTKALMINSAEDRFQPGWDVLTGWGYIDGAAAFAQRAAASAFTVAGSGTAATYFQRSAASATKATLVWNRDVSHSTTAPTSSPLKNLDLKLYSGATGLPLASSTSLVDNVEQVQSATVTATVLRIDGIGFTGGETQRAALAYGGGFVRSSLPAPTVTLSAPSAIGPSAVFTVTASISNAPLVAGLPTLPLTSTTATLIVPASYSVSGSVARPVAAVGAGGNAQVSWTVTAPAAVAPGLQTFTVNTASIGYELSINGSTSTNVPATCTYVVSPTAVTVPSTSGTTTVSVATGSGCPWTPVTNASTWLTVPSQQSGSGTLTIAHAANTTSSERVGTVTISGTVVTITQQPAVPAPRSYYLAEGATGAFFDLDIVIANPNDADAPVVMTFLDANGNTYPLTFTLPAKRSRTVAVEAEVPALASADVSTIVTSPSGLPLVVERSLFWDATYYGGHTGNAVDGPKTTWYFGEGFQAQPGVFDTFILLANASATKANVTLTFLRQGGTPVSVTREVGATSRANFWAAELPAQLGGQSFSTVVTSDIPIIAERAMYFGSPLFNGGHESAGVSAPATNWFHPEGRTGPFFDTYILIGNPGTTPANVTVRFLRANDTPITTTRTVGPQSRETIYVDGEPGLPDNDVSTEVTSDVPVISERAMYWPGGYAQWYEAHNSFGVTSTGVAWGLAEGRFGFPQGFETYILLTNPTNTPTRVRVTFLRQGSRSPVTSEQVLGANARANVDMSALLNASDYDAGGERFGAIIESLDNVGIAVERAMYFSTGGVFWSGGTNATGVKLR